MVEKSKNWYRMLHPKAVLLVTTVSAKGSINCAPFAWATPLNNEPPILLISPWYESHTFANISNNGEFVVNIAPYAFEKQVETCAKDFPEGVNELEKAGLSWYPSSKVKPPRIEGCVGFLECKARKILKEENAFSAVIADVLAIDAKNYDDEMRPKIEILLHLGGKNYMPFK